VKNIAGDVGIIGGNLPPALSALIGGEPHEAYGLIAKGLKAFDFHAE
jgi:hypothetical protein